MTVKVGSIYASLEADFRRYNAAMNSAAETTDRTGARIRRSMGGAADAVTVLERHLNRPISASALLAAGRAFDNASDRASILRGALLATTAAFGGLTAVLATNVVTRYADTWTNLKNQIGTVTKGTAEMRAMLGAVSDTADRSFSSIGATATLYTRIQRSAPNHKPEDVLSYVETVQKGLLLGGATMEEARSAAIQFSQAIASNRLGGDEMRAVLETPLGGFLAKGLGVSIGELRKMGSDGLITTQQMLSALRTIGPEVDAAFGKFQRTLDQSFTLFDNKATEAIGKFNETYGVTSHLAGGISALAGSLETLVPILAAVGIGMGVAFTGRLAGGAVSRATASFGAFANVRQAALAAAQEQVQAVARERAAVDEALSAKKAQYEKSSASGDFSPFASRASVKAAAQAEAEIVKNQKDRLTLAEKLRAEEEKLAKVQAVPSARAAALAKANAKSDDKISSLVAQRAKEAQDLATAERRIDEAINATPRQGDRSKLRAFYGAAFDKAAAEEAFNLARNNRDTLQGRSDRLLSGAHTAIREDDPGQANYLWRTREAMLGDLAKAQEDTSAKGMTLHRAEQAMAEQNAKVQSKVDAERIASIKSVADAKEASARRLARIDDEIDRQQIEKIRRSQQISVLNSQADANATAERSRISARMAKLSSALSSADATGYYELRGNAEQARADVHATGRSALTGQISELSKATTELAVRQSAARIAMDEAATAASRTGLAWGMLKGAGSSLVAFLGGPWGVAFTTATIAMAYFGAQSLKTAEDRRRARQIIDEETNRTAEDPNAARDKQLKATQDIISRQADAERERQRTARDELMRLQSTAAAGARVELQPLFQPGTEATQATQRAINDVIAAVRSGSISIDEMISRLEGLGVPANIIDAIRGRISGVSNEARRAAETVAAIGQRIAELDGKKASVTIAVNSDWRGPIIGSPDYDTMVKARADQEQANRDARFKLDKEMRSKLAAARGDKQFQYEDQISKEYGTALDGREVSAYAKKLIEIEKIAEAHRRAESAARRQDSTEEKLQKRIADMIEQAKGSYLGDIDRKVLEEAKGMKFDPKAMAAYRTSAENDNFAGAPKDLMRLREAAIGMQAGQDYRSIIQEMGDAKQAAAAWAEKQEILNRLVADGKITASQAATEMGKFVSSFGNYAWVNELSGAITDLARSAVIDFRNINQAALSFVQRLETIIFNALIGKPLENWITGLLGGMVSGGGGFGGGGGGGLFALVASLFHTGGTAGEATSQRAVAPSTFSGAPRFHTGLLPGELPAILLKGEAVLNTGLTDRIGSTMGGLADMAANSNYIGGTYAPTIHMPMMGSSGNATADRQHAAMVRREMETMLDAHAAKWFARQAQPGGVVHQASGTAGGLKA